LLCGIFFLGDVNVNRIREIMTKRGITQEQLSEITGINQGTLSKIINGKGITLKTAQTIARVLHYPVDYIWPDE